MISSFHAFDFGCDNMCDIVGDGVCAQSTCKREVQAASPSSQWLPGTLGKLIPQGQTGKEVKPLGACAVGRVRRVTPQLGTG